MLEFCKQKKITEVFFWGVPDARRITTKKKKDLQETQAYCGDRFLVFYIRCSALPMVCQCQNCTIMANPEISFSHVVTENQH